MVSTNYLPLSSTYFPSNCLYVPRLLFDSRENSHVPFHDMFGQKFNMAVYDCSYFSENVEFVPNTSSEIADVVMQGLREVRGAAGQVNCSHSADTCASDLPEIRVLQGQLSDLTARLNTLYLPSGVPSMPLLARMGDAFILKYKDLLRVV